MYVKSLQFCLTLCDPMDCSPPGSSAHGILQASILEGVAVPSSRGPSQPRDQICFFYVPCIGRKILYHWHHLESPVILRKYYEDMFAACQVTSVMFDCATPWTATHQASPSMGFSRQEHWSGVPLPSPGNNARGP